MRSAGMNATYPVRSEIVISPAGCRADDESGGEPADKKAEGDSAAGGGQEQPARVESRRSR